VLGCTWVYICSSDRRRKKQKKLKNKFRMREGRGRRGESPQ